MSIRKENELPEDFMIRMGAYFSDTAREDYFRVAAEIMMMREEVSAYKAMLFQAQTERDVARATVCTSPWEDSPPCRGIQRQLDKIAALEVRYDTLEKVAKAVAHTWKKGIEDGGDETENAEALVATLDALAALVGEG